MTDREDRRTDEYWREPGGGWTPEEIAARFKLEGDPQLWRLPPKEPSKLALAPQFATAPWWHRHWMSVLGAGLIAQLVAWGDHWTWRQVVAGVVLWVMVALPRAWRH